MYPRKCDSSVFILLAETRLCFSTREKRVPRMQEGFCVGEFSMAELIIILEISRPNQPTARLRRLRNTTIQCSVTPQKKGCSQSHHISLSCVVFSVILCRSIKQLISWPYFVYFKINIYIRSDLFINSESLQMFSIILCLKTAEYKSRFALNRFLPDVVLTSETVRRTSSVLPCT